jgi:hypothetical protein
VDSKLCKTNIFRHIHLKTTAALCCQTAEQSLATPLSITIFELEITTKVSDKEEEIQENFP